MPASADYRRSATDRALPLRARGDLQILESALAGHASFVVQDPVTGEAFHLSAEEHALLDALRQPRSLRFLQRLVETRFAPRRATIPQLQQFVNQLYEQGLLVGDRPGQGAELQARGARRRRSARWTSLLSVLAVKLGSFNAGPLVERLYGACGWLCSRWALALAAALVGFAALVAIGNAPALAARLPHLGELARPGVWLAWIAAIAAVKTLHELGHALACRHQGARPREMGVLLLAGAPSLYCDVSDAWRLPGKWQRMAVSSAGMGVELVIAAAALLVWRYAEPGLLSTICLSLIVICSVGTLLINANPLLRYDGYYLLSDWLEVPNLAERARGLLGAAWRRWLLGESPAPDPLIGPHKRRALWAYAILSKAYLAVVLAAVFALLLKLARPHQLQNAVYTLAAVAVAGMMLRPAIAATRLLQNPATRARFRWLRLGGAALAAAAAVAGAMLLPLTRRVDAPLLVVPARSHPLFAEAAGELQHAVAPGAWVEAGDVVARLKNPELHLAVAAQQGAVRESRLRLAQLKTLQAVLPAGAHMIPAAAAELADAEAQLAQRQAMAAQLVVRAPAAGRVWPPPERATERRPADTLRRWEGSPLEVRNRGAWIEPGAPIAVVAERGGWTAWAGVKEADVAAVAPGQAVRMLFDQQPLQILPGRVTHVARQARSNHRDETPPPRGSEPLGDSWYHVVQIELDPTAAPLLPAARGTAKIATYRSTVGALLLNQLRRTFQRVF